MFQALLLASAVILQDPKPAAKTVEERLQELDQKLASLEKKQKTLADENAAMEKQIVDRKAQVEKMARVQADMMITPYAKAAQISEQQTADLKEMWYGWLMEDDRSKVKEPGRWVAREAVFKSKLTPEQLALVTRKIRDDQVQNTKASLSMFSRSAKLSPEKSAALEKAALGKISFPEGIVLAWAHPQEMANAWGQALMALESSLSELSATLTEEEVQALRKTLDQWKPRQR